jgi:hypothetical protein
MGNNGQMGGFNFVGWIDDLVGGWGVWVGSKKKNVM